MQYASVDYPIPQYSVMSAIVDGLPAVVTINGALLSNRYRATFPHAITVRIDIVDVDRNDLPTPAEKHAIDDLSDAIETAVTSDRNAVFAAQQTWNSERVLLFYARDRDAACAALDQLSGSTQRPNAWRYAIEDDSAWRSAEPYFSALRPRAS